MREKFLESDQGLLGRQDRGGKGHQISCGSTSPSLTPYIPTGDDAGTREDKGTTEQGSTRGSGDKGWRDGLEHRKAVTLYATLKQWQLRLSPHCSRPCSLAIASFKALYENSTNSASQPNSRCMSWAGFRVVKGSSPLPIF